MLKIHPFNVANRIFLFQMNRKEKETFPVSFAFLTKDFSTPAFESFTWLMTFLFSNETFLNIRIINYRYDMFQPIQPRQE